MKTAFKKIAVLGAGTMGPCIAQVFAVHGCDVSVWSRSEHTLASAGETARHNLDVFVREELLSPEEADLAAARISFTASLAEAVKDADLVLETITESREAKQKLYLQLDSLLSEEAVLASNTSALNPFELVPPSRLKQTMILHWYTPAQIVPLVDVVKSEQMAPEICDAVVEFLRRCEKTPVVMKKFINGYISNRIQLCINQEVFFLLDNGYCTPEDIDEAVRASIIPRAMVLGLCRRIDFNGLDIAARHYLNRSYVRPPEVDMPAILAEHYEKGEFGLKTGKGLFDYTGQDKDALLEKRDRQLFDAFRLAREFMKDPV